MTKENQERELERVLDELGIEVDLTPETELNIQQDTGGVQAETTELTIYKPVKKENTQNITKTLLLEDGTQLQLNVLKRPECPSCGYIPAKEGEPGHLTGNCFQCGTQTCPRCKNRCESCGKILCNNCTTGHGSTGETLCTSCLKDVDEELKFERLLEAEKEKHKQELDKRKEKRKQANQLKKHGLKDRRIQLQALRLLLQSQKMNQGKRRQIENSDHSVEDFHKSANDFK